MARKGNAFPPPRHSQPATRNRLRIIGGEWRGRKLAFPPLPGLRPTPDRVRETLFNWLREIIPGARCLDLFAGSGALSFEALSRGAQHVTMVEQNTKAAAQLRVHLHTLQASGARIIETDALHFLRGTPESFDVVFLDPPFRQNLLEPCLELLATRGWLAPHAWLYLETEKEGALPPLPANWEILRSKQAGQVAYHLIECEVKAGTT